jgi:toxin-antitoxin system PIN domain toxin
VTALDTNVLVYAHLVRSPFHVAAAGCLRSLAEGSRPWAIPWPCVHEFLGTVTRPGVQERPAPQAQAFRFLEDLLGSPSLVLLGEGPDHMARLRELVIAADARGGLVHDARIAAICLSHGVSEFWTADRDFGRFPALRVRNPLVGR